MTYSLIDDFKNKLLVNLDYDIFQSPEYNLSSRNSILYYNELISDNDKNINNIIVISNSSIESHLIAIFSILSPATVYLIGEEIEKSQIKKLAKMNNIDLIIKPKEYYINDIEVRLIKDYLSFEENNYNFHSQNNIRDIEKIISTNFSQKAGDTIFMSSGSTDKPKIIPLKYENINSCYQSVISGFLKTLNFRKILSPNDTSFVSILPHLFAFSYDKESSIFASSIKSKVSSLILIANQLTKKNDYNLLILVPSAIRMILNLIKSENDIKLDKSTLISAGEPLDSSLAQDILNYKIKDFYNVYGATEVAPWILFIDVYKYMNEFQSESYPIIPVGNTLPNVNCLLTDESELVVSSKNVFSGYLNDKNNSIFTYIEDKKYYKTGDRFRINKGLFFCEGRINGAIKLSGHFVNPVLIEAYVKAKLNLFDVLVLADINKSLIHIILFNEDSNQIYIKIKEIIHKMTTSKIPIKFNNDKNHIKFLRSGKIDRRFYKNKYICNG